MSSKRRSFMPPAGMLSPEEAERRQRLFDMFLERNKLRRRPGEDPPTAELAPVDPGPKRPPLAGGAAVPLTFDE